MANYLAGVQRTEEVGGSAVSALAFTAGQTYNPTVGVTANTTVTAEVLFKNDTEPVSVKITGGVVYPYRIVKVVSGTGIIGLY